MQTDTRNAAGPAHRYLVLALLTIVVALNAVDRKLIAVLAEPIKAEFALSDGQLGLLSGIVFAIFYAAASFPIAWLADRSSRIRIIAAACFVWSLFTGICGMAGNFVHLLLARIGVAVGEAGGVAPSHSVISDYYPDEQRGTALGIFTLGIAVGTAAATIIGGTIAEHYGWRMTFYVLSVPGIVLAGLILFLLKEPVRGALDAPSDQPLKPVSMREAIVLHFGDPVLLFITLGSCFAAFIMTGVMAWAPAFLMREKGMSLGDMSFYYGIVTAATAMFSAPVTGRLADMLKSRGMEYNVPLIPAISFALALPFLMLSIWFSVPIVAIAFLSVAMFFFGTFQPACAVLVQNLVPANRRSIHSSIHAMSATIIGIGGGATFIGFVSDHAMGEYAQSSLSIGFIALVPFFFATVFWYVLASRKMKAS